MDKTARTRQRVLAMFLPIAAVLYISAEALSSKGTDQVVTDTVQRAQAAGHRGEAPGTGLCRGHVRGSRAGGAGRLVHGDRHAQQRPRFGPPVP